MRLRYVFLPIIFCFLVLLCGCSTPVDIRDRAIVQAMGIDYEDNEYKITLQEYKPQSSAGSKEGSGGSENIYVISKGKTLFDALKNAEAKDGNQIFYGHSRVFLIGEDAAKEGILQIAEFMNSNYQLSLNSAVMLTEGSAEKIMQKRVFRGVVPDISVERIEGCGKAPDTAVIDVLREIYNLDGTCCLPLISADGENEVKIENCVVFKDKKPWLLLDNDETMGLTFLNGKISDAVMVTREQDQNISVNIVSEQTNLDIETNSDDITINVKVNAKGNISEIGVIHDEKIRKEHVKRVEEEIKKKIKNQVEKAFEKIVIKGKCDLFYLKQRIKNTDKNLYQQIKDNSPSSWLSKIKLNVEVDFVIRHSGIQVR